MTYQVRYRAEAWIPAANGAPERRQVVSADIGDGTTLMAVIVRSDIDDQPRIAEARIEQPYNTRTTGWKRRTVKRLRPQDVEVAGEAGA